MLPEPFHLLTRSSSFLAENNCITVFFVAVNAPFAINIPWPLTLSKHVFILSLIAK